MSLRGKPTEKKLTEYMKGLMKKPEWWFHRFPDAGVCRGRIQKQPADYLIMYNGAPALVEAKECDNDKSIPKSRLTQLAKMKRFQMAGGIGMFVVSHPHLDWKWRMFEPCHVDASETKSVKLDQFKLLDIKGLFREIELELDGWGI